MIKYIIIDIDLESIEREIYEKYNIEKSMSGEYEIKVLTDLNEKYDDLITNYDEIRESLNNNYQSFTMDIVKILDDHNDNYIEDVTQYLNKENNFYDELFNNAEYILVNSDSYENTLKYLKNNSILKTKKIVLDGYFSLEDDIDAIKKLFKDYDNIYIRVEGNDLPVSICEYEQTKDIVNNLVNEIKKYNLSTIEQIMYAYDIARDRVYKEEEEGEFQEVSRDLSKILLGDKIVCVGYQVLFRSILNKLNIKNLPYFIAKKDSKIGHAINMIFINDKKYNIKGFYYFDPTWDSKRKDNNNYLLSYRYFALTKDKLEDYQKHLYNDITLPYINKNTYNCFKEMLDKNGNNNIPEEFVRSLNKISRMADNKRLISPISLIDSKYLPKNLKEEFNEDYVLKRIKYLIKLFDKPLSASLLLKVLYNVRKIEYYNNPSKYPFDIASLYAVIVNSNWMFYESKEYKLLKSILGEVPNMPQKSDFVNFIKDNNCEEEIEHVKLTRTLKNIYENKLTRG